MSTNLRARVTLDALPASAEVRRVVAREALSTPFDVEVELWCDTHDLDLEALLWTSTSVCLDDVDAGAQRAWHGVVEEAEHLGARGERAAYRLRLRPALHGLAYRVRSRVFQDQDAPAIVKAVLRGAGVPDDRVVWRLTARYPTRELCMQYRESELDFVSRLLEDEGIFYWFEHTEDAHTLVLADAPSAHAAIDAPDALRSTGWRLQGRESVSELVLTTQRTLERHNSRDWNWRAATDVLEAERGDAASGGYTRFEYPGGFTDQADGARRAQNRLDESLAPRYVLAGASNCARLAPGRKFTVVEAQPDLLCREWLATSVTHIFREQGGARADRAAEAPYRVEFAAMPSDLAWRPPRVTPRPRVVGKEIAVVTSAGDEIHTDEHGRIKVHFYWDREGRVDDTASCWIRTQQMNTSGAMIIPRIGWEVSVAFLDGDPDRPVVLQKLYNQETMPPYDLPGSRSRTALQSSSSPGGGGTNEIRFEDAGGGMEFFVHASKDFKLVAGNNVTEQVGVDSREETLSLRQDLVGASEKVSVSGDQSVSVTGASRHDTGGDKTVKVGGNDVWGTTGNCTVATDGARSETIAGMMFVRCNAAEETFNSAHTRSVGAAQVIVAGGAVADNVAGSKTETTGAARIAVVTQAVSMSASTAVTVLTGALVEKTGADYGAQAKGALTLNVAGPLAESCGGDFNLTASSITVLAPGGFSAKGGGSKLDAKGAKIKVSASSLGTSGAITLKLKGNINYKP